MRQALAIASRDLRSTYLTPFGVGCTAGFAAFAGVLLVVDLRGDEARLDAWFAPLYVVVAVGLAVSAATGNPLAAAVGTAAVLLGLWGMGVVAAGLTGRLGRVLSYLAPSSHVTGFLRGTLALTDLVYFLSFAALGLLT